VAFEVELSLERVVDGLDGLTQRFEDAGAASGSFAFEGRSQQPDTSFAEERLELASGVALVGDKYLTGAGSQQCGLAVEEVAGYVAFVEFGVGQRVGDGQPGRGADQVEAQTQK
jgi:hypothetical protein